MKRVMVFWLVLLLPIFVLSKEYESKELKIKFDVNDDYIVLTRDNLDDSVLVNLNTTKEKMKNIMKNNNIYFDIIKKDMSYEIIVVVPKKTPSYANLSEATEEELTTLKDTIIRETGDNVPIIYKNDYAFVVVNYQDDNGYVINYYTVVDSKGYNIQMQKKTMITEDEEDELKKIVDSIKFIKTTEKKKEDNKKIDYKIIIYSAIMGLTAGIITYYVCKKITKEKKK